MTIQQSVVRERGLKLPSEYFAKTLVLLLVFLFVAVFGLCLKDLNLKSYYAMHRMIIKRIFTLEIRLTMSPCFGPTPKS